jgi:colicin import membrane protein
MAIRKVKLKARTARRSKTNLQTAAGKVASLDLKKYIEDIRIGKYSWDDILKGTSKNMEAVAAANRAILDGYADIARRQYGLLKGILRELRKVRGDRDEVVKELKRVVERIRKDVQTLQNMARKTNSKAQRIVSKRAEANIETWKRLVAEAKKSVGAKLPGMEVAAAVKKAAPKKKPAASKKAAPKKKAAPRTKAAPKKKAAARKRPAAAKRKS